MMKTETTNSTIDGHAAPGDRHALAAIACGALGVAAAVWAFWLVLPGTILGIAAIVLGLLAHRRGAHGGGSAAVALGIVALFLVPSVLVLVDQAESWGRDCTLHPNNPDC